MKTFDAFYEATLTKRKYYFPEWEIKEIPCGVFADAVGDIDFAEFKTDILVAYIINDIDPKKTIGQALKILDDGAPRFEEEMLQKLDIVCNMTEVNHNLVDSQWYFDKHIRPHLKPEDMDDPDTVQKTGSVF